jgi:predicted aldo/keto reductase-like oxidoreductase
MPCPEGVDIPGCFENYNDKYIGRTRGVNSPMFQYMITIGGMMSQGKSGYASQCKSCNKCVKACPQHIPIPKRLKEVAGEFESPAFKVMRPMVGTVLKLDRWRNMRKAGK